MFTPVICVQPKRLKQPEVEAARLGFSHFARIDTHAFNGASIFFRGASVLACDGALYRRARCVLGWRMPTASRQRRAALSTLPRLVRARVSQALVFVAAKADTDPPQTVNKYPIISFHWNGRVIPIRAGCPEGYR